MPAGWPHVATLLNLLGAATTTTPPTSGDPGPTQTSNPAVDYLTDLLDDTREELTRADSKAALLLAAAGVIVGALIAGLLNGRWTPSELDNRVEWVWWVGVAAAASGILSIAAAIYPRIRRRGAPRPGVPTYYGDIAAYENIDSFRLAIEGTSNSQKRLIDQVYVVSKIVQRKYVLLRRGLLFFGVGVLMSTIAILINIPLNR